MGGCRHHRLFYIEVVVFVTLHATESYRRLWCTKPGGAPVTPGASGRSDLALPALLALALLHRHRTRSGAGVAHASVRWVRNHP